MDVNEVVEALALRTGRGYGENPVAIGGGSVGFAFRFDVDNEPVFVKIGQAEQLVMFEAEAEGLKALSEASALKVPDVLDCGTAGKWSYLAMDWLELGPKSSRAEQSLGRGLALQHRVLGEHFGWHRHNTVGVTHQPNDPTEDWLAFLRDRRIGFQVKLAASNNLPAEDLKKISILLGSLEPYFYDYQPAPSLLHGDLWAGNWGTTIDGEPVLYDPAVYFGDREADLAMTRLFGGFGWDFYNAYEEAWPLVSGWESRVDLYNLYHLLNHFNIFGDAYLPQLRTVIERLMHQL